MSQGVARGRGSEFGLMQVRERVISEILEATVRLARVKYYMEESQFRWMMSNYRDNEYWRKVLRYEKEYKKLVGRELPDEGARLKSLLNKFVVTLGVDSPTKAVLEYFRDHRSISEVVIDGFELKSSKHYVLEDLIRELEGRGLLTTSLQKQAFREVIDAMGLELKHIVLLAYASETVLFLVAKNNNEFGELVVDPDSQNVKSLILDEFNKPD